MEPVGEAIHVAWRLELHSGDSAPALGKGSSIPLLTCCWLLREQGRLISRSQTLSSAVQNTAPLQRSQKCLGTNELDYLDKVGFRQE
jgi:hypothetical protein